MGNVSHCQGPVSQRAWGRSAGWPEQEGAGQVQWCTLSPRHALAILGRSTVTAQRSACLRALLPFPPDDLASKANILIDPLELQAATMDDLDEDEEPAPAAAQVPR